MCADQLRGGSTVGGYEIVTTKEVPMIFRVNNGVLQYSQDNGITWADSRPTSGTATAAQLLSGYTAYVNGSLITGTMPIAPDYPSNYTAIGWDLYASKPNGSHNCFMKPPAAYYQGPVGNTWIGWNEPNLLPANIKAGVSLGNGAKITGTFTSDATASAAQIVSGYTAYVNGNKLTGTIPNWSNGGRPAAISMWTGGGTSVYLQLPHGYTNGSDTYVYYTDGNLSPPNIKAGTTILGVTGSAPRFASGSTTSTTVAATLGWQPSKVFIKYSNGGWMWLTSTGDFHYRTYGSYGAVNNYYYYSIYSTSAGAISYYSTGSSISATGFSVVVTGQYGGDTFYWYAWE